MNIGVYQLFFWGFTDFFGEKICSEFFFVLKVATLTFFGGGGGKKSELTKWERHLEVQVRNQQFFEKRVGNLRVSSHGFLVGVRFSSSKFDFQHFF